MIICKKNLTPQEAFLNEWLLGTTCHRHNRLSIHWQSDDGRFVILKHAGHSEYTGRYGTGYARCETRYCLYDITAEPPNMFGFPSLMRVEGRWSKKHQAEAEKIIEGLTAPKRSRLVQKLIDRLKSECGLEVPDDVELHRTRASYDQRSAGAWSWYLKSKSSPWQVAGFEGVTTMLKHPFWRVSENIHGDTEIDSYKTDPGAKK